jgi:CHASE2 domain-containing sensor protein
MVMTDFNDEADACHAPARDYGGYVERLPSATIRATTVGDVVEAMRSANKCGLKLAVPAVALWLWLLGLSSIVTALVVLTARQAPTARAGLLLVGGVAAALLVLLALGLVR